MSVNSILTNSSAANALLNFNKTQSELSDVQNRLSTGQKVGSAKDNASTFAIALGLRSDVATFKTVKENLATGSQIVDSSLSVATSISDQISKLKTKLTQAKDQPQGRELIQQDIDGAIEQIQNWTKSATFNGINLLDGKGADAGQKFSVTASLDRNSSGDPTLNSLNFDYQDLSIEKSGKGLGDLLGVNVRDGAATETKTAMPGGLLTADFQRGATFADGDQFNFSYKDASGAQKTVTMTQSATGTGDYDFADAATLATKLTNLTQVGGVLENSGLTFTNNAGTLEVRRATTGTSFEVSGITTKSKTTGLAVEGTTLTTTKAVGDSSQIKLAFNEQNTLKPGDDIKLTINKNGKDESITFRVSSPDDTQDHMNGSAVSGSENTYWLNYKDVVGSKSSPRTGSQVAELINFVMNNTDANDFAASADGAKPVGLSFALHGGVVENDAANAANVRWNTLSNTGADFSVEWDGKNGLNIVDKKLGDSDTLKSFNVNGNSSGLDFDEMMKVADKAEQTVKKVLGSLGSASSRLTAQSGFVDNMVKTLNNNVSTLVDADMAEEAARLQALQTKSQLGIQALSTANQSTQSILSLFR